MLRVTPAIDRRCDAGRSSYRESCSCGAHLGFVALALAASACFGAHAQDLPRALRGSGSVAQPGVSGVGAEGAAVAHSTAARPEDAAPAMEQGDSSSFSRAAAYVVTLVAIGLVITGLYWSRGAKVVSRILLYLFALSTMKLSVKYVFKEYRYNYPKFVTGLHFLSGSIVAAAMLLLRGSSHAAAAGGKAEAGALRRHLEASTPTRREFWCQVFPISLAFAVSVGANNAALVFSSAAFAEIVGATSPVVSAVLVILFGMPFALRLLPPTLLVVCACALSTSGELNFSPTGMAFCVLSMVARSVKTTLQQYLMQGASKEKFDPVTLLLWMCLPSSVLMTFWSLAAEGFGPYRDLIVVPDRSRLPAADAAGSRQWQLGLMIAIGVSCMNACVLNLAGLFCTRDLGAVGVQLAAQTKSVLTVLGGVALFNEAVTTREVLGFAGVLAGVFWFSRLQAKSSPTVKPAADSSSTCK